MKFSETLLQLRKAQGLSQEMLAEKVGVSRQAVSKWETGEALPDLQKAALLSQALDVSLDELCGKEVPPAAADATAKRKRYALPVLLSVIFLCVGFLVGGLVFGLRPEPPAMPDEITISGIGVGRLGEEGPFNCQFVPSVAGDDYTYRIVFIDHLGGTSGFDAVCNDGVCTATAELPCDKVSGPDSYLIYRVAVMISNGVEDRMIPIGQLNISYTDTYWKAYTAE